MFSLCWSHHTIRSIHELLPKIAAAAAAFFIGLAPAIAADAAKQAEVRKGAESALADFYKSDPKLKGMVEAAPGYAVFTTYGLSFLVGGAGGKCIAHDKATKKTTYMELAQASAGAQIGASETRYLFIFKSAAELQQFIDKGWDASASAAAGAGTGKQAANASAGAFTGGQMYTLTKTGLQAGVAAAGTKVWKDKDLN